MKAGILLSAAAAMLLAPLPALAEDWRQVGTSESDKATIYVDRDSITTVDGKRHFRIKVTQEGEARYVISNDIVDCSTKAMDAIRMEVWQDGKLIAGDDFPIGKYHYEMAGDPNGEPLIDFVCGPA